MVTNNKEYEALIKEIDFRETTVIEEEEKSKNLSETLVWKGWELVNTAPALNRLGTRFAGIFGRRMPKIGPLKKWTAVRTTPAFAADSLHERVRMEGVKNE